ncbi:multifunctional expression regulator [Macacine alphaherpesvirus 1]|uniref:Multifunctional expression regulator n=1 Tax=Macacine alphaherpesvirus 2 TaxID=2845554 RepID=A0A1X9WF50_9ALPH|nr:multifunctional expression regulator [Macacine alphaherpesvirus 1]ARS01692.1 multifunctional expression regulator [Macacine alphaherpesvirus 2]
MAADLDMLVDLGLDLSDSDFEDADDAPGAEEAGPSADRAESDSTSGQCSASSDDEDMEASGGEDGGARPAATAPPRPEVAAESGAPRAAAPAVGVWARLGRRRRHSEGERPDAQDAGAGRGGRQDDGDGAPSPRRQRRPRSAVSLIKTTPGGAAGPASGAEGPRRRGRRGRGGRRREAARAARTPLHAGAESRHRRGGLAPPSLMALAVAPPKEPGREGRRRAGSTERLGQSVRATLRSISERAAAERVSESFGRSAVAMHQPFDGAQFAAPDSPWAPVLGSSVGGYNPEQRRVSWETLALHGPGLYRTFVTNARAAAVSRTLRECVLRQESFVEAVASADELLSWCRMCVHHGLPLRPQDPIVATAGAVLDNLSTRLRPFLRCYFKTRGVVALEELCARRRLSDIKEIASFVFVTLARVADGVKRQTSEIEYSAVGVGPGEKMDFYVPGACMAGLIEILDTHRQECASRACELTASHIIAPLYVHGKYFYCNSLF